MGIRDFLNRLRSKKEQYNEYEREMKIAETYEERKKSANERELERFQNEAREKAIKVELDKWREARKQDIEFGHQILDTKNMYKNDKPTLMKQKNIFAGKSNLNTKGGLFFK